jgi:phosphoglucosamine mutase
MRTQALETVSKELFGTDGIRGIPGEYPLDDATLARVGASLGEYLLVQNSHPRVLIGMDTRESGPHIAERLAQGLVAGGSEPVFAGVLTTPGIAWLVAHNEFSAGVVVSASHNPYYDNGVKLISATGTKFPDAVEAEIERSMAGRPAADGASLAHSKAEARLHREYLRALRGARLPGANLSGMKVILDCANGAASELAPKLFRSLGAEVVAIHDRPDGRNINDRCGSLHPESMQKRVIEAGAAIGVAFDGDADRAIFSTATGKRVDGDGVLLAASRYMKSAGKLKGTTIVGTTMANLGLERVLARDGLHLARVPVGDRYVLEEMQRIGANLGGEQSGHIIFLDNATTGDGMLTAIKITSLVSLFGPLDQLVADLKAFPQTIVNVKVREKPPLDSLSAVAGALVEAEQALGNSGRVILRYSGTEPLARIMVEAEREEDVRHWANAIAAAIQSSIGA